MSGAFLRISLVATGVIAAFIITTAGPVQTNPVTSGIFQGAWSQVTAGISVSHSQSYMMMAGGGKGQGGPTVRDHRSGESNGGSYDIPGGKRYKPQPVSPGNGEGGVTVTPTPKDPKTPTQPTHNH